jgi:hypothetical protein
MTDYSIAAYDTAPRGLASNSGFEAEDRARAELRAQNALNCAYLDAISKLEVVASMLWQQEKHAGACNEIDFIKRFIADHDMVSREYVKNAAVLPQVACS